MHAILFIKKMKLWLLRCKTLLNDVEDGMAVGVGRLRNCPLFDVKFVLLGHNTLRGAAGGAIHNAELLVAQNWVS